MAAMNHHPHLKREDKFEEALALLAAGIPLETILAEAGQDENWLRPLLEIAGEVGGLQQVVPIPPPNASLQKLLAHGRRSAAVASPPASRSPFLLALVRGSFRLAAGLATVLLVMVLLGGTLNLAAQRSLPGDTLYWLKQAGENLRLSLSQDPMRREELLEAFNRRRLSEIEALLEQAKEAEVTFEQTIESLTATAVKVDGVTVEITAETEIIGQLAVGARVQVEAVTRPPDRLVGLTVRVLEPGPTTLPAVTPTPTWQPTPSPAATLSKSQATDSLPALTLTPVPAQSQEADTIELPPTLAADNDNENTTDDNDKGNQPIDTDDNDNDTGNDDGDDEVEEIDDNDNLDDIDNDNENGDDILDNGEDFNDNDDLDDGADFGDDNFNDDDNDGENENDEQDSKNDRSGSDSGDDTSGGNDGNDDNDGDDDDDGGGSGDSDDNEDSGSDDDNDD
jgi:hypothetical protein